MYTQRKKYFYSPRFSLVTAVSVRRLAWALHKPMTATVDHIIRLVPSLVEAGKVCLSCEDKTKCQYCAFRNPPIQEEKAALSALV